MNKEIFRLYDIRGRYPSQINEREVFDIALRLLCFFNKGAKIFIGHDPRNSSLSLTNSLINGLLAAGFNVIDGGLVITPMVDFFVRHFKADGGVMVTASHNPKEFNGLYVVDSKGSNIGGSLIYEKIKNFDPKFSLSKGSKHQVIFKEKECQLIYADFISKKISISKKLSVIIDCSNGSAGPIVKKIKFPSNLKVEIINASPNGNFLAHGPDPTKNYAFREASRRVLEKKADVGIVFDADGDRALVIDNKGKVVFAEHIWRMVQIFYPQKSLVYSPLSQNLIDFLRLSDKSLSDLKFVTTPVGNIFIKKACFKNKSAIGVETSMHFYFVDDYFGGSGLLAMAKIVSALSNLPYSLSDFVSMMPKIIRAPEYSFRIKNRDFLKLYRKIYKRFLKKAKKFSYVDGISVFGDSWWFNLRPSNTQDLMRINIEAKNQSDIKKIKSLVLELIKN